MNQSALPGMLRALCLTQMASDHEVVAAQAAQEGWTFAAYLRQLCDNELAARSRRRT